MKKLIAEMTRVLGDHVSEVKINPSLIDSPVCISIGENVYDKTNAKNTPTKAGDIHIEACFRGKSKP